MPKIGADQLIVEIRNEALVRAPIDAFAPDIVYGNGPLADIVGIAALRDYFVPMLESAGSIEFRVSRLMVAGNQCQCRAARLWKVLPIKNK